MRTSALIVAATLALAVLAPATALAQDDADRAIELFEQAIELYRDEAYGEAATLFETAYGYDPSPRIAYNAGRAHELAGTTATALEWYILALSEEDPALEELVEEAWTGIDQALGVEFMASFGRGDFSRDAVLYVLFDEPDEARLSLSSGITIQGPARLIVPPDDYTVTIEADGYAPQQLEADLSAGEVVILEATMLPGDVTAAPDEQEPMAWRPMAMYSLAGVGGLGLLGGLYFYGQTKSLADEMADLREAHRIALEDESDTPEAAAAREREYDGVQADANSTASLSNISYIVGALGLAGAAALYFTTPDEDVEADVSLSPTGVQLRVRF